MATILNLVQQLRIMIRDTGVTPATQAFPDDVDGEGKDIPGTSPELQQFVTDSVQNYYSRYQQRKRSTSITFMPGQLTYTLPTDWMTVDLESFRKAIYPQPIPSPLSYALPWVSLNETLTTQVQAMEFDWYDDDLQLVISSSVYVQQTITFNYFAYHQCDTTGCSVPVYEQRFALLMGAKEACEALATDYGVKLQKYRLGGRYGLDIDDSVIAKNLQAMAKVYDDQFVRDVKQRPFGMSGGDRFAGR